MRKGTKMMTLILSSSDIISGSWSGFCVFLSTVRNFAKSARLDFECRISSVLRVYGESYSGDWGSLPAGPYACCGGSI